MKRILVIDDEELLTRTFSILLERNGYEVYVVKNGEDARVAAEEEEFDLIICDIRMPGLNGVETIKAIKVSGTTNNKNAPVIFITGFADDEALREAHQLKPLECLRKPFDNAVFLRTINECFTPEKTN
jgi:CheY-like chemotaxis protein